MNLAEAENIKPSARHKLVARLVHAEDKAQIENLQPVDYGHYLIHSLDLKVIIPALSHPYPRTRCLAVKAFHKAWLQSPPGNTAQAISAEGLADILNTISFHDAKSLSEKLGHHYRGPNDPRTHILDKLVSLLVPSISKDGSSHPVARLGSTLATMYIPAVSPAIVSELLKFASNKDTNRLRRLLRTQPGYVGQFLQSEFNELRNPVVRWNVQDIAYLFTLRGVRDISYQSNEHWGISLFTKFITAHTPRRRLYFNPPITELIDFGASVLKNTPNDDIWASVLDAILDRAELEVAANFATWKPIILMITNKMSRGGKESGIELKTLQTYLKRIGKVATQGINEGVNEILARLSPTIRQDVLISLHNHDEDREWVFPDDAGRINIGTVMHLKSAQGRPILRKLEPYFSTYSTFPWNDVAAAPLANIFNNSHAEPVDREDAILLAVKGRWAYLEGDLEEKERTLQGVERWKKLVHRQRQSEGRVKYTQTLFEIIKTIGDVKLLKEVASWAFERFYKDVDVRPRVFQSKMEYCVNIMVGKADNLEETARDGDETISLLIDTMSKARTEPSFRVHEFTGTLSLCLQVLRGRVTLCQNHSIDPVATTAAIAPIKDLLLRMEGIQLEDPGTFGEPTRYPGYYEGSWSNNQYPLYQTKYRRVLIRFLDDLSRARDTLYAEKYSGMLDDQDRELAEPADDWAHPRGHVSRDVWPWRVESNDFRGLSLEKDAPFLHAFVHKIVYTSANKTNKSEQDPCYGRWDDSLELYVSCADTAEYRDTAIQPIIEHYRTNPTLENGEHVDLSPHLLTLPAFRKALQKSEFLTAEFFKAGLIDNDHPKIFFNTPDPDSEGYQNDANLSLFRLRSSDVGLQGMIEGLTRLNPQRGTSRVRRQIAIVAVLMWIRSLRGLEPADKDYSIVTEGGSKLDFAALYSHASLPEGHYSSRDAEGYRRAIISQIDQFTTEELQNLVKTVKSMISRIAMQPHRDSALRKLIIGIMPHSHIPTLLETDIFDILVDKERSSLHRNFLNQALLATISPDESKRLTRQFFELISTEMTKKVEKEPNVKISTIKYLVTFAAQPYTGLSLEETTQELDLIQRQEKHPSIQESLLIMLTAIIVREGRLRPQVQLDTVWDLLQNLAMTSCSLDERRRLTAKDWSKSALPEIASSNERPGIIVNVSIDTIPIEDRSRWATMVDGMLSQQVHETKRWMGEFLRRHGANKDQIDLVDAMEVGPLLQCLSVKLPDSYNKLRKYLPKNSWHLKILQFQVTSYLSAKGLDDVSAQLDKTEPDWKRTEEGTDFVKLLNVWKIGRLPAFQTLTSTLQNYGSGEVRNSLQVALGEIFTPALMLVSADNPLSRTTPWGTLIALIQHFRPPNRYSNEWKKNIRPILTWLADRMEGFVEEDKPSEPFYFGLSCHIKTLLLPFPFYDSTGGDGGYANFATSLYDLAFYVLHMPPPFQGFNVFLTQILSPIISLVGDFPAVAKCLIEQAEEEEEEEDCLLGYRLAQCFMDSYVSTKDDQKKMGALIRKMETHPNVMIRLLALNRVPASWETPYVDLYKPPPVYQHSRRRPFVRQRTRQERVTGARVGHDYAEAEVMEQV